MSKKNLVKHLVCNDEYKEDKINKGEHRSKKAAPTTFYNRNHLKGWAKIPIPKQIEDEHIENKNVLRFYVSK